MTEKEVNEVIATLPVGARLQLVMKNGEIKDVVLASHETAALEEKKYDQLVVPALPPAIIVHGGRWGIYRIDTNDISHIARVE